MDLTLNDVVFWAMMKAGARRIPKHEHDYGDVGTIGLCVKRSGVLFSDMNALESNWGIFLGEVNGQWHIGTRTAETFHPTGLESFESLEEMKRKWILD